MKIACCFGTDPAQAAPWVADLRAALPHADVQAGDCGDADYAVVWRAPQAFFDGATRLRAIFAAGAGVDALLALRLPAGVPVVRLEDAGMGAQMAEYVVQAVLHRFRSFDRYARQQSVSRWQAHPPESHADWPIGILGLGTLGVPVARALRQLGFPVAGWTRTPRTLHDITCHHGREGLGHLLSGTRVLVDMLPLTPDTRDLIDGALLGALRPGAYFINVARGEHVVEADLLAALDSGRLAGATLDVCRNEPAGEGHPFWAHPGIVLTPHIAAATLRPQAVRQIADGIGALERGDPVPGRVRPERGY